MLQPSDSTLLLVLLGLGFVLVVTLDYTDIDHTVRFRGEYRIVTNLNLMNKTVEYTRTCSNAAFLGIRVCCRIFFSEGFTIWSNRREIPYLFPSDSNNTPMQEKVVILSVDSPQSCLLCH